MSDLRLFIPLWPTYLVASDVSGGSPGAEYNHYIPTYLVASDVSGGAPGAESTRLDTSDISSQSNKEVSYSVHPEQNLNIKCFVGIKKTLY